MASRDYQILVEIDVHETLRFSKQTCSVTDSRRGRTFQYVGGIAVESLPSIGEDGGSCSISIPRDLLDCMALRTAGMPVGGARARVSLWPKGEDYGARIVLLDGVVLPGSERYFLGHTEMELGALEDLSDLPFPPNLITTAGFPGVDAGQVGTALPVIVGRCRDVALVPLGVVSPSTEYLDLLVAGHRISAQRIPIRKDARTGVLDAQVNYRGVPGAGQFAFVSVSSNDFDATNFVADVPGIPGPNGPVSNLGDVVSMLITNYSGLPPERVDSQRIERARPFLNRIVVASQFGGNQPESLVSALRGRYEQAFPISISWRGGRLGVDYLGYDVSQPVASRIGFGRELIARRGPARLAEEGTLYSRFRVRYDYRNVTGRYEGVEEAGAGHPLCDAAATYNARAGIRGGVVRYQDVSVRDVNESSSARAILDSLAQRFAVARGVLEYVAPIDLALAWPLRERFLLTDDVWGWSGISVRLDSVGLDPNDLTVGSCAFSTFGPLGR